MSNGGDITKRAEALYLHCGPSGQNKNERKVQTKKKTKKKNKTTTKKHENE